MRREREWSDLIVSMAECVYVSNRVRRKVKEPEKENDYSHYRFY